MKIKDHDNPFSYMDDAPYTLWQRVQYYYERWRILRDKNLYGWSGGMFAPKWMFKRKHYKDSYEDKGT